ncbi:MAG: hypothetical protein A2Y87_02410 [Bacteroidetes bacterium RBG_13_46_8]|nr:MAG: hypothetical protein A2Y87_02410 [Bacteroidetes bacterium RBG_13_46_8]
MKRKFELEYPINSSPKVLFDRLSTPDGLSEWFAENVNQAGNIITFIWEGTEQKAEILHKKDNRYIRFRWLDEKDDKTFFEFRITRHELTGDVSLLITDFCHEDEKNDAIDLWDKQVAELKHVLGL